MVLWAMRNFYIADTMMDRKTVFHPITFGHVKSAVSTVSTWFVPRSVAPVIRGILLLVTVAGLSILSILLLRRQRKLDRSDSVRQCLAGAPCLLLIFSLVYGVFLTVSISFFDASTSLGNRILSPVYVSGLVLVLCVAHRLLHSAKGIRFVQVACVIICLAFAGSYLVRGTIWVVHSHNDV